MGMRVAWILCMPRYRAAFCLHRAGFSHTASIAAPAKPDASKSATTAVKVTPAKKAEHGHQQQQQARKTALIVTAENFDKIPDDLRNKDIFLSICTAFNEAVSKDPYKRGHVEFIYKATECMKSFGVERDIDCYNAVLDCFPKGVLVAESNFQVAFHHFPRQQECCMTVLDQLQANGCLPNKRTFLNIHDSFGEKAHPMRKFQRIMYWLPKLMNANPYMFNLPTVKEGMPDDPLLLAILALKRMAVDHNNKVKVYQTKTVPDAQDHTFVASAQAPDQCQLVSELPTDQSVFVTGPHQVWLRWKSVTYFTLQANPKSGYHRRWVEQEEKERKRKVAGIFDWEIPFTDSADGGVNSGLIPAPGMHEQTDGTILAMCVTGSGSLDSLRSWIKCLQEENAHLRDVPVVFKIRPPNVQQDKRERELQKPRLGKPPSRGPISAVS